MVSLKPPASNLNLSRRIRREIRTMELMVRIYCRHHHRTPDLCPKCEPLRTYAIKRIIHCHFKNEKPACSKCPVHCFKPDYREQIRKTMRFAGPRMSYRYPILALFHILDKYRSNSASKQVINNDAISKDNEKA